MIRLASGLLAGLLLAAPASAATVETALGPVTVGQVPERVAVFDIAALDTVTALGVRVDGAPVQTFVPGLADLDAAPVGTIFEPDLEALSALAPDLVIAGGRSSAQVKALSQVAPTLDMTIGPDLIGDARQRLAAYGTLFGREAEAERLDAALGAKLDELAAAAEGKGSLLILLTNGPKMSAFGRGSRFGWLHEATGMAEAVPELEAATHGDAVSFEFIARTNPDWLFVIDRGAAIGAEGASARAVLDNPLVRDTTAWTSGQVVYLDPAEVYVAGGGYRSLMGTLEDLVTALDR
ncbi:siderophore ABC transporter substrate-binding protein [Cereibacter azotoformans]|uniref:Iron complex transport system substrate-binding protein n=1 Tax=Cereibacter azotoformans TaxID=43057 RepID=A0A2T5JUK9_9RHOB|nr:siderophore ABC transporter substrate-binding protein [Cereibacter azotoformans]PTR13856.1 iron complex transport system substrate-binding protein [Cereibacter azotoformans]